MEKSWVAVSEHQMTNTYEHGMKQPVQHQQRNINIMFYGHVGWRAAGAAQPDKRHLLGSSSI